MRLSEEEFERLRRFVLERCGIWFDERRREVMLARLGALLREGGYDSFSAYWQRLQQDRSGREVERLIEALTTNFTGFFREPDHFDFLRSVLPELPGRGELLLWSAGCASGEEAYSMAITLLEAREAVGPRRAIVLATDISHRALAEAQRGVYGAERLRGVPPTLRARYFQPAPGGWRVREEVRELVRFRLFNLLHPPPFGERCAAIFCRNVMIYFPREVRARVANQLTRALLPGGYLVVGHVETLTGIDHELRYVRPSVYQKVRDAGGGGHDQGAGGG